MSQQYVEIELDGKTRLLRFNFNTVSELEERLGKGIIAVLTQDQIGFNLTRTLYWAGLKWKDRGLTIERTGQMLQKEVEEKGASLETLMEPVVNALMKSGLLGKVDEDTEEDEEEKNENPA